jgi:hypothetical protein
LPEICARDAADLVEVDLEIDLKEPRKLRDVCRVKPMRYIST